jgi:histidine triad (HIT) family protein
MKMQEGCVFCAIINGSIPAKIIQNTDTIVVIEDIAPKAPIHYLIIPKKHIHDVSTMAPDDAKVVGEMFIVAQQLAHQLSGSQSFRLVCNNGPEAGQTIFHLHVHFLSGKTMLDL